MKKFHSAWFMVLLVSQLLISAGVLHARPAPPEKLIKIFEYLSRLEEDFKSEEWEEANKVTNTISSAFKETLPQLKKNVQG